MSKTTTNVVSQSLTTIEDAKYVWVVCFSSAGKAENGKAVPAEISDETIKEIKEKFRQTLEAFGLPFSPNYAVLSVPANENLKESDRTYAEIYAKITKETK